MARIANIATAVPKYRFSQADAYQQAQIIFAKQGFDISRFSSAFLNTQIEHRHSVVPMEWYLESHNWTDRNRLYIDEAVTLLQQVAVNSLDGSGFALDDVTDVLTVSTTGIATPSLEAMLMDRLRFKSNVRRTPIFGLGCAGGLMGLNRAQQIAAADDNNVVLLLVVELCSLNFMRQEISKQNIIATALFADGAAGVVLSNKANGPKIVKSVEHRWPDSLSVMGWDVTDNGLEVVFSRSIPDLVKKDFRFVLENFFEKQKINRQSIQYFLSHPGGAKVMDELEQLFELPQLSMHHSRAVLRDCGNMSAPTVLFVLKRAMDEEMRGRALLTTFGPGFSAVITLLEA
ncbi:MAG: type III polyketide synthase [Bdellovibrionales bacterium]